MPHQIVEYSANLDSRIDIGELVAVLHDAAAAIDALPLAGLRTRAVRREVYKIADDHPDNAFVHVVLRIAQGRTLAVQQATGKALFDALCAFLAPVQNTTPLAISYEIQEIETDVRWNNNNLREHLAIRAGGSTD